MENRNGFLVDVAITDATLFEPTAAAPMLDRRRRARQRMSTLGGDKGYYNKGFVALLRGRKIAPRIARIEGRSAPGLDARTTRHEGYAISQQKRKRIEEILGWMTTVSGFRKSRFVGIVKTQLAAYMAGAAYNLLRMARLRGNANEQAEAQQRVAEQAATAQAEMIDGYKQRIHDKIMRFIVLPPNMQGNPEAEFDVLLQPDGNPLGVKLKRSSGNAAYDSAVERAVLKAQPLPLPSDAAMFKYFRELTLRFRAQG